VRNSFSVSTESNAHIHYSTHTNGSYNSHYSLLLKSNKPNTTIAPPQHATAARCCCLLSAFEYYSSSGGAGITAVRYYCSCYCYCHYCYCTLVTVIAALSCLQSTQGRTGEPHHRGAAHQHHRQCRSRGVVHCSDHTGSVRPPPPLSHKQRKHCHAAQPHQ
jgi:hypothetical protein